MALERASRRYGLKLSKSGSCPEEKKSWGGEREVSTATCQCEAWGGGGITKPVPLLARIKHDENGAFLVFLYQAGEALTRRVGPVRRFAGRTEPSHVPILVEPFLAQHRMGAAESNHATGKLVNLLVPLKRVPVKPTDFVVLAICVVIAALSTPEFITAKEHRNAARDEKRKKEVLDLTYADRFYSSFGRRTFGAVVISEVIAGPIAVVLSVRFIVLISIAHQIVEGEIRHDK